MSPPGVSSIAAGLQLCSAPPRRAGRRTELGIVGVELSLGAERHADIEEQAALRQEAWRLMHRRLAAQHRWYTSILRGHYGYYDMPHNYRALDSFREEVGRIWFNCLRRRSQKGRPTSWEMFDTLTVPFALPLPRITHPWATRT
jgi:hypothetical protein